MLEELFDFLKATFVNERVELSFGDKVTQPGFTAVFYEVGTDIDRNLDGTANLLIGNYVVQIWHDSLLEVKEKTNILSKAMDGTKFQILSITPVRVDGNKRKWHQQIVVQIMEDA